MQLIALLLAAWASLPTAMAAEPVSCPSGTVDAAGLARWSSEVITSIDAADERAFWERWIELPDLARCLDAPLEPTRWAEVLWFRAVAQYNRGDPAWKDTASSVAWMGIPLATRPGPPEMTGFQPPRSPIPWSPPAPGVRCWANGQPLSTAWEEQGPKLVQCALGDQIDGRWVRAGPFPTDLFPPPEPAEVAPPVEPPVDVDAHGVPWLHLGLSATSGAWRWSWRPVAGGDGLPVAMGVGTDGAAAWTAGGDLSLRVCHPDFPWLALTGSARALASRVGFAGEEDRAIDAAWRGDLTLLGRYAHAGPAVYAAWGVQLGLRLDDVAWPAGSGLAGEPIELRDGLRFGAQLGLDAELEYRRLLLLASVRGWPAFRDRGYAVDASATVGVRLSDPVWLTLGLDGSARALSPFRVGGASSGAMARDTTLTGSLGLALRLPRRPTIDPEP